MIGRLSNNKPPSIIGESRVLQVHGPVKNPVQIATAMSRTINQSPLLLCIGILFAIVTGGCDSQGSEPVAAVSRLPASSPVASESLPASVDLDSVGALERLRSQNPEHFRKISEILSGLATRSQTEAASWVRVKYDVKEFELGNIYLVSLPPKQQLSFTLDGVRYRAIIVQPGSARATQASTR